MTTRRGLIQNNNYGKVFNPTFTGDIIQARVYSIIHDENHEFFEDKEFDPKYIGWIFYDNINLKTKSNNTTIKDLPMAKPYMGHIKHLPLINEIVDIVKAPSDKHYIELGGANTEAVDYYKEPINIWNNSAVSPLPKNSDVTDEGAIKLGEYISNKVFLTQNMVNFEGDTIINSRFGSSIRLGSSNPQGKNPWSNNEDEGDPIIIISNGQSITQENSLNIEDINGDASSIYLTSQHRIDNFEISSGIGFDRSLGSSFIPPSKDPSVASKFINSAIDGLLGFVGFTGRTFIENETVVREENYVDPSILEVEEAELIDDIPPEIEGGFEDFVKLDKTYEDNNKVQRDLYFVPKKYSNGTILVADILVKPLSVLLEAAENDGIILIINSGFRPPIEDIYYKGDLIQKSQKTLRIQNLKSKYKNKIKEPWLEVSTAIRKFNGYEPGDTYNVVPQSEHFKPLTSPSYKSKHGVSLAVDFSTNNASNNQYKWLSKHGWKYGFVRTVYNEAWHFRYSPSLAQKGATAKLAYNYEPGKPYNETTNYWNNVFGPTEPNWAQEWETFQEQQARKS